MCCDEREATIARKSRDFRTWNEKRLEGKFVYPYMHRLFLNKRSVITSDNYLRNEQCASAALCCRGERTNNRAIGTMRLVPAS